MVGHLDRRVVDADDLSHYEETAFHSELVSTSPLKDVLGPNTERDGDYVVSTL
jgi:hypothetical protein